MQPHLSQRPFRSVLVANRGEIAVRVIQACQELGLRAIAVYSDADRRALHVQRADEAYRIGPPPAAESYLRVQALLDAARLSRAEAIHPGYGFLAENAEFADGHGATLHLGERECSIQRRHQKLVEESPSPAVDAALRAQMGADAVRAARAVGYVGAGTVEFLLDDAGRYHFLEMNTRIQVE